jgi:glycosyltransferase involved in cell wall biosynthesis
MLRSSGFYGGPERQIHQHALASQHSDFQLIVGAFARAASPKPELLEKADEDGVETQLFEVRNSYDPAAIAKVRHYLQDSGIAILATHDYRASIIGFLATRGTDCQWLAWSRGWTYEGPKVQLFQLLEKLFVRFASRVMVVAKAQGDKLRRWRVPQRKVVVVHNAVDPDRLMQTPAVDLRQRFSLPADSIVIVTAGRFSEEKGQQVLVRSVDEVVAADPRVRFIMFGDGPKLEQTRAMAANLDAAGHVVCPGFEKNIIGHLRGADIVINPSLTEGLPNVVLEAMAVRVPVIATAVGGVPELITDNENGRLVPAKDPSPLGRAIVELAGDHKLRERFAAAGLQTVIKEFSFEAQSRKLHEVYTEVLG